MSEDCNKLREILHIICVGESEGLRFFEDPAIRIHEKQEVRVCEETARIPSRALFDEPGRTRGTEDLYLKSFRAKMSLRISVGRYSGCPIAKLVEIADTYLQIIRGGSE
jgi:hypothetical protein